ncbi:MAG: sterol desaturase family protein [Bacteroidia bacterium]|nr:sterol desaturase family protein [Bacteroidia bacterium]
MNILIFVTTFFFMEFVAWFTHKYVMHGFLWSLHEDHHTHTNPGFFEKNDAFFLIFAIPSMLTILLGSLYGLGGLLAIGLGILAYGICYFLVHDVFIHQRFKWLRNSNNFYFRAIRRAHKLHHKHMGKEDGECFGMLVVPFRHFLKELKRNKA